ncbi:MAG: RibD family protein, partial [Candidatus Saccharibacteria bacterium]
SQESAILIGTNTALFDNPALTVREWCGTQPIRMVIDRTLRLENDLHLFDQSAPTWVFTTSPDDGNQSVKYINLDFEMDIIPQLLTVLYEQNILSLVVEGGSFLLNSFLKTGLWDEAFVYTGNQFFGKGVKAPPISGHVTGFEKLDDCKLHVIRNTVNRDI